MNKMTNREWLRKQDDKTLAKFIAEVKGFRTRDYVLRRKMFEYKYPQYEFEEVR